MADYQSRPRENEHLRNIISGAKGEPNHHASILRDWIKSDMDKFTDEDVARVAELVLEIRMEHERAEWAKRN